MSLEDVKITKNITKIVPKWCPEGSQGSPRLQKTLEKHQRASKTEKVRQDRAFFTKKLRPGRPRAPQREPKNEEKAKTRFFCQRSEIGFSRILGVFGPPRPEKGSFRLGGVIKITKSNFLVWTIILGGFG